MGSGGQLPKGFPEGMLTALTDAEIESLKKNPILGECFEPVNLTGHPITVTQQQGNQDANRKK